MFFEREMAEIDITQPRECIGRAFKGNPGPCPRCGNVLRQDYLTYLITAHRDGRLQNGFIAPENFGWLCPSCPTIVVNSDKVSEMIGLRVAPWEAGTEFAIVGIVDVDAVPVEKWTQLGRDARALPLIEFSHISGDVFLRLAAPLKE